MELNGAFVVVALLIVLITHTYDTPFKDTFVLMVVLMVLTYIVISVIDNYKLQGFFAPLQELVNLSNKISNGTDLSKRLVLDESGKRNNIEVEIVRFSKTFNRMFERLETSFKREKQFSRDISHEIKTPLAVIISNCEYAQDCTDDPKEIQETLKTISEQAKRISDITTNLSTLAKMDGSQQKLDYEIFCIDELVKITADEVAMEYEYLNKNITINVSGDSKIMVHADHIMMVRLFINLLSNSVKYGSQDGTTNVYLHQNGQTLECRISDNGIGISEDDLPKIWETFFRVDHSNPNSTGLGLPMVKKIVLIHGGKISVDSTLHQGTEFYITLPIAVN
jgi:signal transduction histidine kinase